MPRLFQAIILLLWSLFSVAQHEGIIRGRVTNAQSGETLPGANIIYGRSRGTITDENGLFLLKLTPGEYTLSIHYVGFRQESRYVAIKEGEEYFLEITLEQEATDIEQVVISAGRLEQRVAESTVSVSIIRPAVFSASHIYDPAELLNKNPGIEVLDGQASVRGGSGFAYGAGSRVLALRDGLPMVSADAGSIRWWSFPMENLSQIEIIKGASSVLYGSSALNGIINFRSADASVEGKTTFYTEAGVFDCPRQKDWIWWTGPRIFSSISLSHLKKYRNTEFGGSFFVLNDPGYRKRNDEAMGRMNIRIRHHDPKVIGLSYGLNTSLLLNNKMDFILWENAERGALVQDSSTATRLYAKILVLDPFISLKREDRFTQDLRVRYQFMENEFPQGSETDSRAQSLFAEYMLWYNVNSWLNINTGVVQQSNHIRSKFYGDHEYLNLAAFGQADISATSRFKLVGGLRMEFNRLGGVNDKLVSLFRAGINYGLSDYTFLRASFGQGYRYPSIAEKFAATTLGAVRIYPNPALKSESGFNAELGIKQGILTRNWDGLVDVALFYTQNKDLIEFLFGIYPDLISGEYGFGFQANNTEHSRVYGSELEFMFNTRFQRVDININGGYVFTFPTEFNPYTGKNSETYLKYRRKHSAKLNLSATYGRWEAGFQLLVRSRMLNIDDVFLNELTREAILPGFYDYWGKHNQGYFLTDLNFEYHISNRYSISAAVKNLTNTEYMGRPGDILPQRSFSLRLNGKL